MNKSTKLLFSFVFVAFTLTLLGYTLVKYVVWGCWWWECIPNRSFQVAALDIPTEMYPSNADVKPMHHLSEEFNTIDDGIKSAYWEDSACGYLCYATYQALRYPSLRKAQSAYFGIVRMISRYGEWNKFEPPFISAKADQTYLVCGQTPDADRCIFVAQYQEYVFEFNSNIDAQMIYERFETIIKFIGEQIEAYLYP